MSKISTLPSVHLLHYAKPNQRTPSPCLRHPTLHLPQLKLLHLITNSTSRIANIQTSKSQKENPNLTTPACQRFTTTVSTIKTSLRCHSAETKPCRMATPLLLTRAPWDTSGRSLPSGPGIPARVPSWRATNTAATTSVEWTTNNSRRK